MCNFSPFPFSNPFSFIFFLSRDIYFLCTHCIGKRIVLEDTLCWKSEFCLVNPDIVSWQNRLGIHCKWMVDYYVKNLLATLYIDIVVMDKYHFNIRIYWMLYTEDPTFRISWLRVVYIKQLAQGIVVTFGKLQINWFFGACLLFHDWFVLLLSYLY